MAPPNSSTNSSAPAVPELDLSDLGPIRSQPVRVADADAFITFLYQSRVENDPALGPRTIPREHGCLAEFDLDHPERVPATYPAAEIDQLFTLCDALRDGA